MVYGLETVDLIKRFSLTVTRMDKIRNQYIRETAQVEQFEDKGLV